MTVKGKEITVHDMTLRDGMHPKRHQMTLDQMKAVATGLDAAGVPLIEGCGWATGTLEETAVVNVRSLPRLLPGGLAARTR